MKKSLPIVLILIIIILAWQIWSRLSFRETIQSQRVRDKTPTVSSPSLQQVKPLSQVVFSLEPKIKTTKAGETFPIDIFLQSHEEILAVDLLINYPSFLKLESIKPQDFFKSAREFSKNIDEKEGKIFYALGSLTPASGSAKLVTLRFKSLTTSQNVKISLGDKTLVAVKGQKPVRVVLPSL